LLNIGADFTIEQAHWPLLTARIEQLQQGSAPRQAELKRPKKTPLILKGIFGLK
jgi:hypothetical protein